MQYKTPQDQWYHLSDSWRLRLLTMAAWHNDIQAEIDQMDYESVLIRSGCTETYGDDDSATWEVDEDCVQEEERELRQRYDDLQKQQENIKAIIWSSWTQGNTDELKAIYVWLLGNWSTLDMNDLTMQVENVIHDDVKSRRQ